MRAPSIVKFILYFILLVMGCACTLSVEEVVTPPVEQPSDPGTGENPGGSTPPPSYYPEWDYYYELVRDTYGDLDQGLREGDLFEVILSDWDGSGSSISGKFVASVQTDLSLHVDEAMLLVDEAPVLIKNGTVEKGDVDISTIDAMANAWYETIADDHDSYYLFSREILDGSVTAKDSGGFEREFTVDYNYVREKLETSYYPKDKIRIDMRSPESICIEATRNSYESTPSLAYYSINGFSSGSPGLEMVEGPTSQPSEDLVYHFVTSEYGDGSEGFLPGDRLKVITDGNSAPTDISGSFTVEFIDASSCRIDGARITISGSDLVVIDDEVLSGDMTIDEIHHTIIEFCEQMREKDFKAAMGDYLLFERNISSDGRPMLLYDEAWKMGEYHVDSYSVARETVNQGSGNARLAVHFSLKGYNGASIELEAEKDVMSPYQSVNVTWYRNGSFNSGSSGRPLFKGPASQLSGAYFIDDIVDAFGNMDDGFIVGDHIYAIVQKKYSFGMVGHFDATVTAVTGDNFSVNIDDAVLEIGGETVIVRDSVITNSSTVSALEVERLVLGYLRSIKSGWYADSSNYYLLTRRVDDGWVAAYDENWNIVRYDLSSFEMTVEGDDNISRRFAFKCKLTGKDADIEMEAMGDSIDFINDTYFHLGYISTGSQGLVMSEGPSLVVDSKYYMDMLGPDSTGELLNYENGDVIEVTLSNYFLELYGSDITGTIKATVSSGDFLITDADFSMDGFEIAITDDDVTIVKNGGIDYWGESTFLSAAKRIIQEARGKLDDPDLVSFTQRRELMRTGTSISLVDDDFIDRDFVVEECSLTRDKSGNESFECRLSNEMARISLSALNCIVTSYVQE